MARFLLRRRSAGAAVAAAAMVVLLGSACTDDTGSEQTLPEDTAVSQPSPTHAASVPTTPPDTIDEEAGEGSTDDSSDADDSDADEPDADEEPLPSRPSAAGDGQPDENPAWLGRGEMTDSSIELIWAPLDNIEIYEIHRVPRSTTTEPEKLDLDRTSLVFSGQAVDWTDDTVTTGDRYWYVFVGRLADGTEFRRTTEAHAVTDTEEPLPVQNVAVDTSADSITLSWDRSADNYLFARYAIRRSVDGEASVYYGTGWTIDQTSFVDDQLPQSGSISYEVIAVDFHGNTSLPTVVTGRSGD